QVGDHLNIFLEYMDGGSLRRRLDREGPMCERQTAVVTRKVLCGLAYLHSNNITHRDIKGANVLLSKKGAVKLADFGTSKPMDQDSVVSGLKGTPNWMAPEVIKNHLLPGGWLQADVWSVGCTVVEMLTGKMPWPNMPNPLCAMFKIVSGDKPPVNRNISREASSFMAACLSTKPPERYTVEQLMGHPFVILTRSARATVSSPPQAQPGQHVWYDDDRLDHHPRADDADRGAGVGGAGDRRHRRLYSNINKTGTSMDGGGSAAFSGTGSYDHRHRHHRHRQEKASIACVEERRPPCRSRETASSGKRGAWSRETGPSCGGSGSGSCSGSGGSGQGEEGQGGRWQQQQQQQQQQVTRWSDGSNDRAPLPPPPISGSGRSSPPDSSGHYGARHIHHHHHHYHHHHQQGQRRQQQQRGVVQEEPAAGLYSMIEPGSTMFGTDCGSSHAEMWPHARDGSADDASRQAEQEEEERQLLQQQLLRQYQHQQGSHSTSAPVPLVAKTDKDGFGSHAGTADRAFMTSPVMNLRPKHRNPPSPGGGFGSGGEVDVAATAPSHGGGRDFKDDGGGGGGGGGGGARGPSPDCSKNSGLRRESSYNSPIQVVQAAREDLMERRKGNGGGGGYGVGVAAAQHHLSRPDDPITGEYLKMGLKGLTDSSSIASRSGFNRWRSNSMPLQCMRTKSAGVLGASPKLPPLERDLSGGAGAGGGGAGLYGGGQRGGEGGGGEFGAAGGRFTRGITSAPTASSVAVQYSSSPFEAAAGPGAIEGCGGAPAAAAAAAAAAAMRRCFRPVERTADRAAGLSMARPSDRSLDWPVAADKGEAVLRSRACLAPIRVQKAPKAVAAEAAAGLSLTALTITPSVSLSAAGLASGGGAAAAPCGLRRTLGAGTGSGSGGSDSKSGFPSCSTPGSASSTAALGGGARGPHHAFVSRSPSNRLDLFPLGSSSSSSSSSSSGSSSSGSGSSNRNR
ncbi:unnamed protein product, partial [Ectocarpus sp. 12 AP-2014]